MAKPKDAEWSDVPMDSVDAEVRKPTPHEAHVAEMADKAKEVVPQRYDLTSKNPKAMRIIHDHYGNRVSIAPGETVQGVVLRPNIAVYLGKGDITVAASG